MDTLKTRKGFISYSWSNEEHQQIVLELTKSLTGTGLEVALMF